MSHPQAFVLLSHEEGFRNNIYLCPEGYPTTGFGRRVRILDYETGEEIPFPFTRAVEADSLASKVGARHDWLASAFPSWYPALSPQRQAVLISLAYQVGNSGLLKFKRMLSALAKGDFEVAALQYLDSSAARQCPSRFRRGARILRDNLEVVYAIRPLSPQE
jgi:lysozyme